MPQIFFSIFLFIVGCCFGSFLSVFITRSVEGKKGIVGGRSSCPHCHKQLKIYNLIPLFSWLWQKGKCTFCHKAISPIYPALELVTGLLFLNNFFFLQFGDFPILKYAELYSFWFWVKYTYLCLLNFSLLTLCFSDLLKQEIPNSFLMIWILITLPFPILQNLQGILTAPVLIDLSLALLSSLIFFGGQYVISKGKWLGSGDIYIAIGMALLLGFKLNILAIICSYLIGAAISLILIFSQKIKAKKPIAFAPFLCLGTLIAIYVGNDLINWYYLSFINL
ncbi:prepilin peptidase [Candidatus Peregrinibacteria bacterium]|nr:prepilin peptidase [Candidatus Peregrinibacteria bacterium]